MKTTSARIIFSFLLCLLSYEGFAQSTVKFTNVHDLSRTAYGLRYNTDTLGPYGSSTESRYGVASSYNVINPRDTGSFYFTIDSLTKNHTLYGFSLNNYLFCDDIGGTYPDGQPGIFTSLVYYVDFHDGRADIYNMENLVDSASVSSGDQIKIAKVYNDYSDPSSGGAFKFYKNGSSIGSISFDDYCCGSSGFTFNIGVVVETVGGGIDSVQCNFGTTDFGTLNYSVVWDRSNLISADIDTLTIEKDTVIFGGLGGGISANKLQDTLDGYVQYMAIEPDLATESFIAFGLLSFEDDADLGNVNYFAISDNIYEIYDNGSYIGTFGSAQPGDILTIYRIGGYFKWMLNGDSLYTSSYSGYYSPLGDGDYGLNAFAEFAGYGSLFDLTASFPSPLDTPVISSAISGYCPGYGEPFTMSVNNPLWPHYRWFKNGSAIANSDSASHYEISPPSASATYQAMVYDDLGDTLLSNTLPITVSPIAIISHVTNVSPCRGDNNGIDSLFVSGGSNNAPWGGNYRYSLGDDPLYLENPPVLPDIAAGIYTITVTDYNGCTATKTDTITQPDTLTVSITSSTNVSCYGGSNGTIKAIISGEDSLYTYIWSPEGGLGYTDSANASGLTADTYTVIAFATYCTGTATATVTITQPTTALSAAITSSTNVLCYAANTGAAIAGASGGTTPYTYSWSPSGGTTSSVSGISAGTYTVTITDAHSCSATATTTITQPSSALSASITSSTNVSCYGGSNGAGIVSVSGGTTGYTYSWSPSGGTTSSASGLTAGTYTVTVTDAHSCTATSTTILTQPSSNPTWYRDYDGDGYGNLSNDTVACTQPSGYVSDHTDCNDSDATVHSLQTYYRDADDDGYTDPNVDTLICSVNTIYDEIVGNWRTIYTLPNGSIGDSVLLPDLFVTRYAHYTVTNGAIVGYETAPRMAGDHLWDCNDTCQSCAAFAYRQPGFIHPGAQELCNGIDDNCNGYIDDSTHDGLTYRTYYMDADGDAFGNPAGPTLYSCQTAAQIITGDTAVWALDNTDCNDDPDEDGLLIHVAPTVSISGSVALCSGSSGGLHPYVHHSTIYAPWDEDDSLVYNHFSADSAAAHGYTPYSWITYAWSTSGTTEDISVSSAGTYSVTVSQFGCTGSASVNVSVNSLPTANAGPDQYVCNGDSISLGGSPTASGGTSPYTYSWSGYFGGPLDLSSYTVANPRAKPLPGGSPPPYDYYVDVTDANGCMAEDTMTITIYPPPTVTISSTNISCYGGNNGTATATASGSASPYSYSWSSGATTSSISGLSAGTYTITVNDAHSCMATTTATINTVTSFTWNGSTSTDWNTAGNWTPNGVPLSCDTAIIVSSSNSPEVNYADTVNALIMNSGTLKLNSPLTVSNTLTLSKGIIYSDTINILSILDNGTATGGSDSSYVAGAIEKIGDNAFTFPLGDTTLHSGAYHPLSISAPILTNEAFIAQYHAQNLGISDSLPGYEISNCEYWTLTNNGSTDSSIIVSLGWNTNSCEGEDTATSMLAVLGYYASTWSTYGQGSISLDGVRGNITALIPSILNVYSQSIFTIASSSPPNAYICFGSMPDGEGYVCCNDPNGCTVNVCLGDPTCFVLTMETWDYMELNNCPASETWYFPGSTTPVVSWTDMEKFNAPQCAVYTRTGYYLVWFFDPVCGLTSNKITLQINPSNPPTVSISGNLIICAGDNTQLIANASGGVSPYTYHWSNGATSSSITVSTGETYGVTVTGANGCTNSDASVTLTVNPLPTITVASPTVYYCGDLGSAELQAYGGITYSWSPATGLDNPNVSNPNASPTTTTTYIVKGTDENGCTGTATVTVTVMECCAIGYGGTEHAPWLVNTTTSISYPDQDSWSYPANQAHPDISISGYVTIDPGVGNKFKFSGIQFHFAPDAVIKIPDGNTLELDNCILDACDEMYEGILVESGGKLIVNGCTIQDAQYAIEADNTSNISVSGSTFDKDYVGIYVPPALSGYNVVDFNKVTGNQFTCSGTLASAYAGQSPSPGTQTWAGIDLNNLSITYLPGNHTTHNSFNGLYYGISATNSSFRIIDANFSNVLYGINAQGSGSESISYTGYGSGSTDNNFYECIGGINGKNISVFVNGANMSAMSSNGVTVEQSPNCNIFIQNSTIQAGSEGIFLLSNNGSRQTLIENNKINMMSLANNYSFGIRVEENPGTNPNSLIEQNNIYMANSISHHGSSKSYGIYLNSASDYTAQLNDIYYTGNPNDNSYGINVNSNDNPSLLCNSVTGTPAAQTTNHQFSINSNACTGYYYKCNTIDKTDDGFYFDLLNQGVLESNYINNHASGLHVHGGFGWMGQQTNEGNLWLGNSYLANEGAWDENFPGAFHEPIIYSTVSSDYPDNLPPASSITPYGWFQFNMATSEKNCGTGSNQPLQGSYCTSLSTPIIVHGTGIGSSIGFSGGTQYEQLIAEDSIHSTNYDEQTVWNARMLLMEVLQSDTSGMSADTSVLNFFTAHLNDNIGKLSRIRLQVDTVNSADSTTMAGVQRNFNIIDSNALLIAQYDSVLVNDTTLSDSAIAVIDSLIQIYNGNIALITAENDSIYGLLHTTINTRAVVIKSANDTLSSSLLYEQNEITVNSIYLGTVAIGQADSIINYETQLYNIASQCPATGGPAVFHARSLYALINDTMLYDDDRSCLSPSDTCLVPPTPGVISGKFYGVCGQHLHYTIDSVLAAASYTWSVTGIAGVDSGQGTTGIWLSFPDTFTMGTINVYAVDSCGAGGVRTLVASGRPASPGSISGTSGVCAFASGASFTIDSVDNATGYSWIVPSGCTIDSGQGTTRIVVDWDSLPGNVKVIASNNCGVSDSISHFVDIVECRVAQSVKHNVDNGMATGDIKVYPNPTTGTVTVIYHLNGKGTLQLYDMVGRLMGSYMLDGNNTAFQFDASYLCCGIFQYIVTDNETIRGQGKLVILR